jgi:hypothetical protein
MAQLALINVKAPETFEWIPFSRRQAGGIQQAIQKLARLNVTCSRWECPWRVQENDANSLKRDEKDPAKRPFYHVPVFAPFFCSNFATATLIQ